jgi:hypothetical protein
MNSNERMLDTKCKNIAKFPRLWCLMPLSLLFQLYRGGRELVFGIQIGNK